MKTHEQAEHYFQAYTRGHFSEREMEGNHLMARASDVLLKVGKAVVQHSFGEDGQLDKEIILLKR